MRKKPRSWLAKINLVNPQVCRLVARKCNGRRPMTNADIAHVSGLSRATIKRLYRLDRWDSVPLKTAFLYSMACGVDLMRPWITLDFIRRRKATHMKNVRHPGTRNLLYRRLLSGNKNGTAAES